MIRGKYESDLKSIIIWQRTRRHTNNRRGKNISKQMLRNRQLFLRFGASSQLAAFDARSSFATKPLKQHFMTSLWPVISEMDDRL